MLPYSEIQTLSLQLLHVERSRRAQELATADYWKAVSEKRKMTEAEKMSVAETTLRRTNIDSTALNVMQSLAILSSSARRQPTYQ